MTGPELERFTATWEPRMRAAFLAGVANTIDGVQIGLVEGYLRAHDVEGALRAVGLDPADFNELAVVEAETFYDAGLRSADDIRPRQMVGGYKVIPVFNIRAPNAERWVHDNSSTFIQEIVEDQRTMIRQHLTEGLEAGRNPRNVAVELVGRVSPQTRQRVGGVIGLHSVQQRWLSNYSADLDSDDPARWAKTLERGLRDRRFDRTVLRAVQTGEPIPAATRSRMKGSYANKALKWRGDTIARTETLRALGAGQTEAFNQNIAKGVVDNRDLRKFWRTVGDERVRPTHRLIPGMNRNGRAWAEPFTTPTGPSMHAPHDRDIQCRCMEFVKVDYIGRAARQIHALQGVPGV